MTRYEYLAGGADDALNVGWLDAAHPFATATASADLVEALAAVCRHPVHLTRGLHVCELCPRSCTFEEFARGQLNDAGDQVVTASGARVNVGNGEIRVLGQHGRIYAAPTMVLHYVRDHDYAPPREFLDALTAERG